VRPPAVPLPDEMKPSIKAGIDQLKTYA